MFLSLLHRCCKYTVKLHSACLACLSCSWIASRQYSTINPPFFYKRKTFRFPTAASTASQKLGPVNPVQKIRITRYLCAPPLQYDAQQLLAANGQHNALDSVIKKAVQKGYFFNEPSVQKYVQILDKTWTYFFNETR